ncbi:MAG: SpoIIE family protein phosphatase, partial [bacterium]
GLLTLKSGDMTIFYTDGVVEATRSKLNKEKPGNEEMQFYGEERLMKLLKDSRDKNASEILKALTDDIESFYSGSSPVDDYTLFAIQKTN